MQECFLLNHVYIHGFRSIIEATVKHSGVRAFDHLEWTYDGAFEQLFCLGSGEFEQKFSKNSNARGIARGGGMFKLRFDWYISIWFGACKMRRLNQA